MAVLAEAHRPRCLRRGLASGCRCRSRSIPIVAAQWANLQPGADTIRAEPTRLDRREARPRAHDQSPERFSRLPSLLPLLKYSCHAFNSAASFSRAMAAIRFSSFDLNPGCPLSGWAPARTWRVSRPGPRAHEAAHGSRLILRALSLAESKQITIGDARCLAVYRLAVLGLVQDEYAVRLTEGVVYRREHSRVETLVAPGDCTSHS